jgi:acyl carrier protein
LIHPRFSNEPPTANDLTTPELSSIHPEPHDPIDHPIPRQSPPMSREEIIDAIKDIIHTIAPDEELSSLATDVRLREQIELDSMDFLDIVMELRKRYGVQVPEEDYKELATLDGCVRYLSPLLEHKKLRVGV